jgi:acetyl esterase/lipase
MVRMLIRFLLVLLGPILVLSLSACQSSRPGTNSTDLAGTVQQDITYSSTDGADLRLDIHYPDVVSGPIPTVVYVHGGAWIQGDKEEGAGTVDIPALLEAGFAVVAVNYRLAPQYRFPAMIEDVKCAIRFLRANAGRYGLATEKIGAYGGSAGGHLVSLLGLTDSSAGWDSGEYAEYSSRVQAVVDMFGPTNLTGPFPAEAPVKCEDVFGTCDVNDPVLRDASPVTWVTADDPPFLILHGDEDKVVPLSQSQILYERSKDAGVDVTLVVVKNGEHGLWPKADMEPSRSELTRMIVEFFVRHLIES